MHKQRLVTQDEATINNVNALLQKAMNRLKNTDNKQDDPKVSRKPAKETI